MCQASSPKAPAPPPPPPEMQDAGVIEARDSERLRRRGAASSTLLTGPQGVTSAAPTATKTLLGQ
jgi:hypothetical protein